MSELSIFLNPIKEENIKCVVSKRFVDENGKPVEWEIKSITSEEDESLRKSCTKKVQVPGRRGQYIPETDSEQYIGKMAAACIVYPNLNDAKLQTAYGVLGNDTLLKAMLKPGEYGEFIRKIQEINGYDVSMEELIEEAKN